MRYKCFTCKLIIGEDDIENNCCPVCGNPVEEMCERDHCHCSHPISETIAYCPDCGEPMCPQCECHDVFQLSRITGYLQSVEGWNSGKQAELKDRTHYNIEMSK